MQLRAFVLLLCVVPKTNDRRRKRIRVLAKLVVQKGKYTLKAA